MKENQRTRLTKTLLKNSLIDLLAKKQMDKITIKEICENAELNRTTFYKYYNNEYDLFNEIEDNFFNLISQYLISGNADSLESLLNFIQDNSKLSKVLITSNVDMNLPQKIFSLPRINEIIKNNLSNIKDEENLKKISFFIFNGGYALIYNWIVNDFDSSPKELAQFFYTTIKKLAK